MRLPKPRSLPPSLPVAATANVGLLAVFLFALATSFAPDRAAVSLPVSEGQQAAVSGAACLIVERTLSTTFGEDLTWRFSERNGEVHELVGPEALYFEASRIVDVDPERTFLLRIDAGVRYAVVDGLLETLRKAGVRNVIFESRTSPSGGA